MSRIANYHDLSIYNSYKKSVPATASTTNSNSSINKTSMTTNDSKLKADNVAVTISESGKSALRSSQNSTSSFSLTSEESAGRDKDTSASISAYKSRQVTQQYQQQSKLFNESGKTINSEL